MQSIPTLFLREQRGKQFLATREVNPEAAWVLGGRGAAYAKWDGTACLVRNGTLYKRLRVKAGKEPPSGWIHWSGDPEQRSGHGWTPIGDGPEDAQHRAAWGLDLDIYSEEFRDGETYELCAPKVQRNPHGLSYPALVPHVDPRSRLSGAPCYFDALRSFLQKIPYEGIVWHHPDGRMAKIKRRDFGLPWPIKQEDDQ